MKGLYFNRTLSYQEKLPVPKCTTDESLIKIHLAGICHTDKEILKGYKPSFKGILGHEFVGEVVQSNSTDWIGKRVVGELNAGCGHCYYCQRQLSRHCLNRQIIGMSIDGCFAEFMAIKTDLLHLVPDRLADEKAVFTEPLAAALSVIDTGHIKPTEQIAVIGDGRLAFLITQVLALTGSDITVIGKHQEKLKAFTPFAKTLFVQSCQLEQSFDIVIEATGASSGMKTALKLIRSSGEIIVKSTYAEHLTLDFSEIAVREIKIRGSRCGPFKPALQLLNRNLIKLPEPEFFDLEDYQKAFASKSFKAGFRLS